MGHELDELARIIDDFLQKFVLIRLIRGKNLAFKIK
jgi:hypothetical protein